MKILIVDDDPVNQKYLSAILSDYGEIDLAMDGVEASEKVRVGYESSRSYNVVFLDIMMPKMDGHETLQAIRKIEQDQSVNRQNQLKVIMVTALGDKENVLSAFSEGCEFYLVKPFKQSKVVQLMEELGF